MTRKNSTAFVDRLDRVLGWLYGPWERAFTGQRMASLGCMQAARIVAPLAPADAAAAYVHACLRDDRVLARWRFVLTATGAFVPGVMWAAASLLDLTPGWWLFGAQSAWLFLWAVVGAPWTDNALGAERLEKLALAVGTLCASANTTQADINESARRVLGMTDSEP
jgi:hypothetical protein